MKEFEKETSIFAIRFDHHKSVAADVQAVLDRAARIDQFSRRYPLSERAQREWAALKLILTRSQQLINVSWRLECRGLTLTDRCIQDEAERFRHKFV